MHEWRRQTDGNDDEEDVFVIHPSATLAGGLNAEWPECRMTLSVNLRK